MMQRLIPALVAILAGLGAPTPTLAQVTAPPTDGRIIRCPAAVDVTLNPDRAAIPAEWTVRPSTFQYRLSSANIVNARVLQCHYTYALFARDAPENEIAVVEQPVPGGMRCVVSPQGPGRFDCLPFNQSPPVPRIPH